MRKLIIALLLLIILPLFANAKNATFVASPERKRVVVLDPGHGGSRPGKPAGKILEKDLNLDVAKEVRRQLAVKMPELVVHLTRYSDSMYHTNRNTDNRLRAERANALGADLTIGIHANAHDNTSVRGGEVWILSLNDQVLNYNKQKANKFASEGDYIDIESIDRSSMGFMLALARQLDNEPRNRNFAQVLCKNLKSKGLHDRGVFDSVVWTLLYYLEGPGALVEMGYMSNPEELKYLSSDKGKREIAEAISDAVVYFIKSLDAAGAYALNGSSQSEEQVPPISEEKPTNSVEELPSAEQEPTEGYTIQLLSSKCEVDVNDSQFKEYRGRVRLIMGSGTWCYKYCFGSYTSKEAAKGDLAKIRERFKDAYIVHFKNGKLVTK